MHSGNATFFQTETDMGTPYTSTKTFWFPERLFEKILSNLSNLQIIEFETMILFKSHNHILTKSIQGTLSKNIHNLITPSLHPSSNMSCFAFAIL